MLGFLTLFFYAAMGETELLFKKTYFSSLKAILLEIVSGRLFYS